MRSYLDGRLRLAVQLTEEMQLLSGNGTAPNLRGLLNRTGLQTRTLVAPAATTTVSAVVSQAAASPPPGPTAKPTRGHPRPTQRPQRFRRGGPGSR